MITFEEIKRRKLGRWALAYIAGAWVLLQVVDLIGGRFGWPDVWLRWLIVLVAIGFVVTLIIGWYHGERAAQRVSGIEIGLLTALFVIAAVALYWVGPSPEPASTPQLAGTAGSENKTAATSGDVPDASLAVLPFENISSSKEQEYFSDGLTEELLNVLAQIPDLRVAARTSAFAFKGKQETVDVIGRTLRVAHVLEGSVRKSGERIRISVQLIDTRTGFRQWTQTYDRDLKDVFAVQDEISRAIVQELRVHMGTDSAISKTAKPAAFAFYLQGTQAMQETGSPHEYLSKAERNFRKALEVDPDYSAALAGLAESIRSQAYNGLINARDGYARADEYAQRALQLNPDEALAHAVLGMMTDWGKRDYVAAEAHYRRALEINPSASRFRTYYGWLLARVGRIEEALREGRRAVETDPLSISARSNYGSLLSFARKTDEAIEEYKAALALDPDDVVTVANLSTLYTQANRLPEAIATAERAIKLDPDLPFAAAAAGYAYAKSGRRADAERMLGKLKNRDNDPKPYLIASIYMGLGDRDATFRYLKEAADGIDDMAADLAMDPVFDPVRDDPRMDAILAKLKLPQQR